MNPRTTIAVLVIFGLLAIAISIGAIIASEILTSQPETPRIIAALLGAAGSAGIMTLAGAAVGAAIKWSRRPRKQ